MRTWVDVAAITRVTSRTEGFVLRCRAGLSSYLEAGMPVSFVPPQLDCPRGARIANVDVQGEDEALVRFEEAFGDEVAGKLVGCRVLVDAALLPPGILEDGADMAGFAVEDERFGFLGTVSDVLESPAQLLLEVARADCGENPILIPYVEEFILDVDDGARLVRTAIPAGLLTLGEN
ncbi:MAG: 16S rRNA processing protein RimM [Eggerthellaceae bacterium]|nr:16S rRNA processing protein RimM [Eggerthellaceae bacterium]